MAQVSESALKRLEPIVQSLFPEEGGVADLEVSCLSGGITNQNFKISPKHSQDAAVVRFFGADSENLGIKRQYEFECSQEAARASVAPEFLGFFPEYSALATRFVPGETLTDQDIRQDATLVRIVQRIRILHDRASFPGEFSVFNIARYYRDFALRRDVKIPAETPQAFEQLAQMERALKGHERLGPCHNDLLAANFIDNGERIWILDWEYSATGNTFFDLANFAVNNQLSEAQCQLVLETYFGKFEVSHFAQLKLLMIASDLREAFWGFVQVAISRLDFDYREYARKHFYRFLEASPAMEGYLRQL